jgi:hypothetical protein
MEGHFIHTRYSITEVSTTDTPPLRLPDI